jgi:hypothetical protein
MTAEQSPTAILDELLSVLDHGQTSANRAKDAIDRELAAPMRTTQVRSLRDAPEIAAFRQELMDGLIRADTANRLLSLIHEWVTRLAG